MNAYTKYTIALMLSLSIIVNMAVLAQTKVGGAVPSITDVYAVGTIPQSSTDSLVLNSQRLNIVVFSGTQCAPCISAIPSLTKLAAKYPDGLIILTIYPFEGKYRDDQSRQQTNHRILQHYQHAHISDNYRLFVSASPSSLIDKWAIQGIPTFAVVDKLGRLLHRSSSVEEVAYLVNYFLSE